MYHTTYHSCVGQTPGRVALTPGSTIHCVSYACQLSNGFGWKACSTTDVITYVPDACLTYLVCAMWECGA